MDYLTTLSASLADLIRVVPGGAHAAFSDMDHWCDGVAAVTILWHS